MKRIVIASDGTWNSPDDGQPTNVLRLARAISPKDSKKNKQVVFYDWGVGSDRKKLSGGISGDGINKNIMDCYRFIVQNYERGDELFFFGFSRGAYTVRSLGGFIRNAGVLKREHAHRIQDAFEHYRARRNSTHPDSPITVANRKKYAVDDLTEIKYIGVWDTVGHLGIPITFWGLFDNDEFLFHDDSPSRIVKHARHALAIDENREDFQPVMWKEHEDVDLKQVWFAGVHCDIGGGYEDNHQLADIACGWLIKEAKKQGLAVETHLRKDLKPKATAKQHNQRKGLYKIRDKVVREIPVDGIIHSSVKERFERKRGGYRSPAFRAFFKKVGYDWSKVNIER